MDKCDYDQVQRLFEHKVNAVLDQLRDRSLERRHRRKQIHHGGYDYHRDHENSNLNIIENPTKLSAPIPFHCQKSQQHKTADPADRGLLKVCGKPLPEITERRGRILVLERIHQCEIHGRPACTCCHDWKYSYDKTKIADDDCPAAQHNLSEQTVVIKKSP